MSTPLPSSGAPILYLVSALLLLWAATRLVRPLSPAAAVVLGLLPLVFTGPALLSGEVYAPIDLTYLDEPLKSLREDVGLSEDRISRTRYDIAFRLIPWRKATRYAIKNGEWPTWNPFILSGDILAAAAEPAVYHPIHLVSHLLPLGPSLSFVAAVFFLCAGLGAFCYIREVGCGEAAAVVGAAGWMFSNFMLCWTGWPLSLTVAFFPLLLLAVRRIARAPGWRSLGLLTAAFVAVILAGHPESALHCVTMAMVYGLCELAAVTSAPLRGDAETRSASAAIACSSVAGILALLVCAVYLLPFLEALPQTVQYHVRRNMAGSTESVPWQVALERMRTMLVPFAYGVPWSEWIKVPRWTAQASAYAGSVLLAPALYGLWRGRWRGRWLMLGFVVFGLLMHVCAPGLTDLFAALPLFEIAINQRLAFVAAFAVPVLAALGCDVWIREGGGRRLGWMSAGVLVALALAIALFWPGMRDDGLSAAFLRSQLALELVPLALACVLLLTVRSARIGVCGLLVILLAQRWVQSSELNPTYPESFFFPPVQELDALPRDGTPYRIIGVGSTLPPNVSTLYELEDARGATPMRNARLVHTHFLWARQERYFAPNIIDLSRPFLSFLNVRYALAARQQTIRARLRGKTSPISAGWKPVIDGRGFVIYENPAVLPRAFVPERVCFGVPLRQMLAVEDFSRIAWIEERGLDRRHPPGNFDNGPGRVTAVERRGLGLHLEVDMELPGWVVVSQTAWDGWRATSGGRKVPLHYGNHAFLALYLTAGHHPVELVYRPRSFVVGRAISFLSVAVLAVLWLAFRPKSPHPPTPSAGRPSPSPSSLPPGRRGDS